MTTVHNERRGRSFSKKFLLTNAIYLKIWPNGNYTKKSCIYWDIITCRPLKISQRCGGTSLHHLQCRRISKKEASMKQVASRALKMEATYFSETSVDLQGLHGVIF
jgi:hypothetical protein